jgi:hypothetical protein
VTGDGVRSHAEAARAQFLSKVLEIRPPMTTVASGRCTSAPEPVAFAIGTNPRSIGARDRAAPP